MSLLFKEIFQTTLIGEAASRERESGF